MIFNQSVKREDIIKREDTNFNQNFQKKIIYVKYLYYPFLNKNRNIKDKRVNRNSHNRWRIMFKFIKFSKLTLDKHTRQKRSGERGRLTHKIERIHTQLKTC